MTLTQIKTNKQKNWTNPPKTIKFAIFQHTCSCCVQSFLCTWLKLLWLLKLASYCLKKHKPCCGSVSALLHMYVCKCKTLARRPSLIWNHSCSCKPSWSFNQTPATLRAVDLFSQRARKVNLPQPPPPPEERFLSGRRPLKWFESVLVARTLMTHNTMINTWKSCKFQTSLTQRSRKWLWARRGNLSLRSTGVMRWVDCTVSVYLWRCHLWSSAKVKMTSCFCCKWRLNKLHPFLVEQLHQDANCEFDCFFLSSNNHEFFSSWETNVKFKLAELDEHQLAFTHAWYIIIVYIII